MKYVIQSIAVRYTIHLIPKWQPVYYSFVYMVISPLCLVNMYKGGLLTCKQNNNKLAAILE